MLVLKLPPGTQTSWNSATWSPGVAVPIAPPSVPKETEEKKKEKKEKKKNNRYTIVYIYRQNTNYREVLYYINSR